MKILVGQIEVTPCQPQVNLRRILGSLKKTTGETDLAVFPELCISGYIIGDMWERDAFIRECEDCTRQIVEATRTLCPGVTVVFGNVIPAWGEINEDGRVRKYNAAIAARNGEILKVIIKTLQPNYREFDETRHFYDARKLAMEDKLDVGRTIYDVHRTTIELKDGLPVAILLCEDCWDDDYFIKPIEAFDFYDGIELVVNISCSPFTYGKTGKRNRLFSQQAQEHNKNILYVNCVGAQNNGKTLYTFDGDSKLYDRWGNVISYYERFEEGVETFQLNLSQNSCRPAKNDGVDTLYKSLVYGTSKFLEQAGIKRIVIGVSGGVDSCLAACLYAQALKAVYGEYKSRLWLVNMPSQYNSPITKELAVILAKNLDCNYMVVPIDESVDLTKRQCEFLNLEMSDLNMQNIQARDRSSRILAAISSSVDGAFTCNGNKSEITVGYVTLWADLAGCFANLADLWKTQVYQVARYINQTSEEHGMHIPEEVFQIRPSAELSDSQNIESGQGDPFDYEAYHDFLFASWIERWNRATPEDLLDWYLSGTIEKELGCEVYNRFVGVREFIEDLEHWWNKFDGLAVSKRVVAPCILAVSRRAYGFDMRESQGRAYYSQAYLDTKKRILD